VPSESTTQVRRRSPRQPKADRGITVAQPRGEAFRDERRLGPHQIVWDVGKDDAEKSGRPNTTNQAAANKEVRYEVNLDSEGGEWGEVVESSSKQVAAAEVVHRQHDALEMAPPDHRREI
jgi:hypothetical protein